MATEQKGQVEIRCPPDMLYRYVTQPWRWHEWHPDSRSAEVPADPLQEGDAFEELIELQPFSPLPFRLRRKTVYRVLLAEPPSAWEVEGRTRDGWLRIRYEFQPVGGRTLFTRILTYQTLGMSRLLMPLLRKRMVENSHVALGNLKMRLEQQANRTL